MSKHYVFSETDINRAELQQYREDSDSVLSFIKDYCIVEKDSEVASTEIFNMYKNYCEECGLKPYSQKAFVQQIITAVPNVTRCVDKLGKRRTLSGIRLGETLG